MTSAPPPTLSDLARDDVRDIDIYCNESGCGHVATASMVLCIERFGPNATVADVAKASMAKGCLECGSHDLKAMPDWRWQQVRDMRS